MVFCFFIIFTNNIAHTHTALNDTNNQVLLNITLLSLKDHYTRYVTKYHFTTQVLKLMSLYNLISLNYAHNINLLFITQGFHSLMTESCEIVAIKFRCG